MEHIDVNKPLFKKDFCAIFESQLPLTDEEKEEVRSTYWEIYKIFIENPDISATDSWLAAKNIFIAKEPQIGERIENQKTK